MKEKILLVSPFPDDQSLYPHLKSFIDELSSTYIIDYFYFSERGYWIENITSSILKKPWKKQSYNQLCDLLSDMVRLFKKPQEEYSSIIAIDNFSYSITSILLRKRNVILWSHDFVSYDQPKIKYNSQKLVKTLTRKELEKNEILIIQDEKRLEVFLKSIKSKHRPKNIFFLPVSLMPASNLSISMISNNKLPNVMQIGGINSYRSGSDQLIKSYQKNFHNFNLFLHGFISPEIQNLLAEVEVMPLVSSVSGSPSDIYKIVNKCDIGVINYVANDLNFYYISRASGQIVEFLRCGKPVIVMGNTSLIEWVEEKKIGVSIDKIDDLVPAIKKIIDNYNDYSSSCKKIFEDYYNLKKYMSEFIVFLESIKAIKTAPSTTPTHILINR